MANTRLFLHCILSGFFSVKKWLNLKKLAVPDWFYRIGFYYKFRAVEVMRLFFMWLFFLSLNMKEQNNAFFSFIFHFLFLNLQYQSGRNSYETLKRQLVV